MGKELTVACPSISLQEDHQILLPEYSDSRPGVEPSSGILISQLLRLISPNEICSRYQVSKHFEKYDKYCSSWLQYLLSGLPNVL